MHIGLLIVSVCLYRLIPSSLSNSSSLQRSIYLIQPLKKNGVERLVRTPFNNFELTIFGITIVGIIIVNIAIDIGIFGVIIIFGTIIINITSKST